MTQMTSTTRNPGGSLSLHFGIANTIVLSHPDDIAVLDLISVETAPFTVTCETRRTYLVSFDEDTGEVVFDGGAVGIYRAGSTPIGEAIRANWGMK